jgi:hypothetical protein
MAPPGGRESRRGSEEKVGDEDITTVACGVLNMKASRTTYSRPQTLTNYDVHSNL